MRHLAQSRHLLTYASTLFAQCLLIESSWAVEWDKADQAKSHWRPQANSCKCKRPTIPKPSTALTKTHHLFKQQTKPTTIPSVPTSSTQPKKLTGARYAWSVKSYAANTAQKAKGTASTTASPTEAGNLDPGHVLQTSGLTETNKRQNVANENHFEKISTLLRSDKVNSDFINIFKAQLQKSSGRSDDLIWCPSNT